MFLYGPVWMPLRTCAQLVSYRLFPTGTLHLETNPRLEINENGARDVSRIVALVVEHVLPIAAFGRKVLEGTVLADSVLLAELLPELAANCIPATSALCASTCAPPSTRHRVQGGGSARRG